MYGTLLPYQATLAPDLLSHPPQTYQAKMVQILPLAWLRSVAIKDMLLDRVRVHEHQYKAIGGRLYKTKPIGSCDFTFPYVTGKPLHQEMKIPN